MSKILVVFGATGNQGGSVIKSILEHPVLSQEFKIRGVTRDPSKPAAQALVEKGVDVVKADLLDKDSLRNALIGAHSVFSVTNFAEAKSKEIEVTQGKNVADIAKEVGVKHLIWSSLRNVTKVTGGKLPNVHHFDGKAEVDEYITTLGVPATFFLAGFYMSNMKMFLKKGEDGTYGLGMPFPGNTPIPLFDAASDTGKFVAGILSPNFPEPNGKYILGATDWYTPDEMLATFSEVTGKPTKYSQVSEDVFKGFFPEFLAQEFLENFIFIRDWAYFGPGAREDLKESLKILDKAPTSFKGYLEKNGPW